MKPTFPFTERALVQKRAQEARSLEQQEVDREKNEAIARFFYDNQRSLADQSSRRDQLTTLISGGALTVSFAFVASLLGKGPATNIGFLVIAWTCWVLALVASWLSFTWSVRAFEGRVQGLSEGKLDVEEITPNCANWIEPTNVFVMIVTVLGFFAFGAFAWGNLKYGIEEVSQIKESAQTDSAVQTESKENAEGRATDEARETRDYQMEAKEQNARIEGKAHQVPDIKKDDQVQEAGESGETADWGSYGVRPAGTTALTCRHSSDQLSLENGSFRVGC